MPRQRRTVANAAAASDRDKLTSAVAGDLFLLTSHASGIVAICRVRGLPTPEGDRVAKTRAIREGSVRQIVNAWRRAEGPCRGTGSHRAHASKIVVGLVGHGRQRGIPLHLELKGGEKRGAGGQVDVWQPFLAPSRVPARGLRGAVPRRRGSTHINQPTRSPSSYNNCIGPSSRDSTRPLTIATGSWEGVRVAVHESAKKKRFLRGQR